MRCVFGFGAICVAFLANPGKLPQERRTANLGLIWPEMRRASLRGIYPPLRRMASIAFVWTSAYAGARLPQVFRAEAQTHFQVTEDDFMRKDTTFSIRISKEDLELIKQNAKTVFPLKVCASEKKTGYG